MSYTVVSNLDQAVEALAKSAGKARVVAGATDLFLGNLPSELVDISTVPDLLGINRDPDCLSVGAGVTHAGAAASPVIRLKAEALAEACREVGSPQVRNISTLGGNVVNAAPAADAAVALVALGAKAVLLDLSGGHREVAVEDLYANYNLSVVDSSSEILLRFLLAPAVRGEGSAFLRFAPREALSLPLVNAAARVRLKGNTIEAIRAVIAPVSPAPTRLNETEKLLLGSKPGQDTWRRVEYTAAAEVDVRGSMLRCSAEYRHHLVGVLARRVIRKALERALDSKEGGDGR